MSIFKTAAIGGDNTAEFEQSFASIAFQNIQKKAPKLMDYLLGFQLVDRNEDETKAVGVFGVQLENQLILLPVFFLSGDIKGQELMYLKNQDMFVPLKENWVNYVLRSKPHSTGYATRKTVQDLGILQPNTSQIVMPPFSGAKYSAFMKQASAWVHETGAVPTLAKLSFDLDAAEDADNYFGRCGQTKAADSLLLRFLQKSASHNNAVLSLCELWPGVKEALHKHYGPQAVRPVARQKAAAASILTVRKPARPKMAVATSVLRKAAQVTPDFDPLQVTTENSPLLDDESRAKLQREGVLVKDQRDSATLTQPYNTQQGMSLANPHETGVYQVLLRSGEFEKCLVIMAPYANDGKGRFATVVQLSGAESGRKLSVNMAVSKIFIRQNSETWGEKGDWFEELPDTSPAADGHYVAVTRGGQGSVVFELEKETTPGNYPAYFLCHCDDSPRECCGPLLDSAGEPGVIFNVRKGSTFLAHDKQLYIPAEAKLLEVSAPRKCRECGKSKAKCQCDYFSAKYVARPNFALGRPEDLQLSLRKKTAEIKVQADHCDVIIDNRRLPKKFAFVHLLRDHGLTEKDARQLLKRAELDTIARLRVVYGPGYPRQEKRAYGMGGFPAPSEGGSQYGMGQMPMMDPNMGSDIPYVNAAVQLPMEQSVPVPGLESGMTDPNLYNPMLQQDPMAAQGAQVAQQADSPGSQDVFDTGVLSALTKVINPGSVADADLAIYAQALNKLGRRLFMFFWHNESFQERYGKKDLPELEDTLRNAFEMLGDLLLYLKQDSVNSLFGTSLSNIGPNIQSASRV